MDKKSYNEMTWLEDYHWWFVARRVIIEAIVSENFKDQNNELLEIGCGTGINLNLLSRFGNVTGIEKEYSMIKASKKKTNCRIIQADIEKDFPVENNFFDGIFLFDVLEHLDKREEILNKINLKLKTHGKIMLTVPAYNFLWSIHDEQNHHKLRFNKSTLKKALEDSRFHIEFISYFNSFLFPLAVLNRLYLNYMKSSTDSKIQNFTNHSLLNSLLTSILKSEHLLLKQGLTFPFGLSLVAVAKKLN